MKRELLISLPGLAVLLGLLSATAVGQDSTSLQSSYPGDSIDPHVGAEQVNDFVVDLCAFDSSSGHTYGVAPVSKTSMYFGPTPWFFNAIFSAQGISNHTRLGVPFVRDSYDFWNTAGAGINDNVAANSPGTPVDTSALVGNQFGYVFSEFSYDDPATEAIDFNQIIGGTVNYETVTPSRLYVSRVVAATNSADWLCNNAQFGVGGVDANGYVSFRGDGFGATSCGGYAALAADNWYRVDLLGRTPGLVNVIHDGGSDDPVPTSRLLVNDSVAHSPPTMIPADTTGGLPILMGVNWNADFKYGSAALSSSTAHLAGASGTRGSVAYSQHNFPGIFSGSTLGTGGVLTRNGGTDTLGLYGLSNAGAPVGAKGLVLPDLIVDNDDGWQSDALGTAGSLSFGGYYSSTFWRGGSGQVAIGKDQSGRLLSAGQVHHPVYTSNTDHNNLIAVARTTNGTSVDWTIAAWTAGNDGKVIYGTFGTTPVGKIVGESAAGGDGGPSLSSPMIDSVGNVYFIGRVQLTGQEFREGLVRAVYDEATFSYRLELVLMEGDVFSGQNSDVDYQVHTLIINGSTGSNPATTYSGNINQSAHNGLNPSGLSKGSPKSIGGILVGANIVYDTSDDGFFDKQDEVPTSTDQDYNVMLFVTAAEDCNDNGVPDDIDIADGTSTDVDGNGIPDECGAGVAYCFGDGTGTPCPCGNQGNLGEGCANSSGVGAQLVGTGSNSVSVDDLGFTLLQALPTQSALLFVANNPLSGLFFGDGLRCAGGSLVRLNVRVPNSVGTAIWASGMAPMGGWSAGDTRNFQAWYRDPGGSPCANQFNTSNGVSIVFAP